MGICSKGRPISLMGETPWRSYSACISAAASWSAPPLDCTRVDAVWAPYDVVLSKNNRLLVCDANNDRVLTVGCCQSNRRPRLHARAHGLVCSCIEQLNAKSLSEEPWGTFGSKGEDIGCLDRPRGLTLLVLYPSAPLPFASYSPPSLRLRPSPLARSPAALSRGLGRQRADLRALVEAVRAAPEPLLEHDRGFPHAQGS